MNKYNNFSSTKLCKKVTKLCKKVKVFVSAWANEQIIKAKFQLMIETDGTWCETYLYVILYIL